MSDTCVGEGAGGEGCTDISSSSPNQLFPYRTTNATLQELTGDWIVTIHRHCHLLKGFWDRCAVRVNSHVIFAARRRRSRPVVLRHQHGTAAAVLRNQRRQHNYNNNDDNNDNKSISEGLMHVAARYRGTPGTNFNKFVE